MHTPGAQVPKCVHPAAKLCRPGAGTLMIYQENLLKSSVNQLFVYRVVVAPIVRLVRLSALV